MWVAITAYVDLLLLIEYRWEQNHTIQNLKESNYDNLFEYNSNVLPYSQNFRFVSYRINLHNSSGLTKRENCKITHVGKFCGLYMLSYT